MGNGTEINEDQGLKELIKAARRKGLDFTAPSRFFDALIAQEIMGFPVAMSPVIMSRFICQPTPGGIWRNVPFYSRDRGAALKLLKHLIPDYQGKPPAPGSPFYLVNIEGHTGGAPTFPLAVCKAALLAAGLYGKEKVYVKPN